MIFSYSRGHLINQLLLSFFLITSFNKPGKTISSRGSAMTNPPITAMARGWCICAPVQIPNARGTSAAMAPVAVINLGRRRVEMANPRASFTLELFNSKKNC
jgi:hypothetical protein